MIDTNETFGGTWPFVPRHFEGNGFRMHYIDEGKGDPIVRLHGEPTLGYLYRRFIPPLSQSHRVIVPGHMGFGKSATPRDGQYSLNSHVENLTRLVDALDLNNVTFVIQDWGIGAAHTLPYPKRIKRLFLLNTLSGYGKIPFDGLIPWFQFVKSTSRSTHNAPP
jgi:pimeloyl-ACP methyl ester carboxylesterase